MTYSPCLPQTPLMGKGSGWNILGRRAEPPGVPVPPASLVLVPPVEAVGSVPRVSPPLPPPPLPVLSPYATTLDLVEALGSKDALLDAYVADRLPRLAAQTLEANYAQLQCWLLARLIRLTLQPEGLL